MFLVIHRGGLDDLPCGLFHDRPSALAFAESLSENPPESVLEIFHMDSSMPCNVSIVEFNGSSPIKVEVVKDFESPRRETVAHDA